MKRIIEEGDQVDCVQIYTTDRKLSEYSVLPGITLYPFYRGPQMPWPMNGVATYWLG